jgi:peptidoglycan/xylan/chitin deacetylase (PgdA/CDA1 family)
MREVARISDGERSAGLLFAEELRAGRLDEAALDHPAVSAAVATRAVPVGPVRKLQRLAMKRGALDFERANLRPLARARREVLGDAAAGPPRFLVRVDEFPLAGAYDDPARGAADLEHFHAVMTEAAVPYLMAVSAGVARDYLDPSASETRPLADVELAALERLRDDGVEFAQHGFDHRTRDARPRHRSELVGLDLDLLRDLLDAGATRLADAGVHADVFVPPFNRFSADQYDVLAERFGVVCGGPESVALFGYHRTPLWRGEAIYMPAYEPFYGRAAQVTEAVDRAIAAHEGLWIPIVLHLSWEADGGWSDLRRLAAKLSGLARPWGELARTARPAP